MMIVQFWKSTNSTDKVDIIPTSLFEFLSANGFRYMTYGDDRVRIPVRVIGNIIEKQSLDELYSFTINTIDTADETFQILESDKKIIMNSLAKQTSLFSRRNILFLKPLEEKFVRDTKEKSYLFFKNQYCMISKDKIEFKNYNDLDGYIFKDELIDFVFDDTILLKDFKQGDFFKFLEKICIDTSEAKSELKLKALRSIIGYLLHRYKDPGFPKAVILMDEDYSDNPEGGTGKGLLIRCLGKVRSTIIENCRGMKTSSSFNYSRVKLGTKIFCLDDVQKNFDFKQIFSLITEDMIVERKYENRFSIPFEDSPKIVLTTNYTILGEGDSYKRRKIEVELSRYFNNRHQPENEFGRLFFSGWNQEQWELLYLCMIDCIQYYLKEGIHQPPEVNLYFRKLKQEAGKEFVEYCMENFECGIKYEKTEEYEKYYSKNPGIKQEKKTFTQLIQLYAKGMDYNMNEPHSGDSSYFILSERKKKIVPKPETKSEPVKKPVIQHDWTRKTAKMIRPPLIRK